MDSRRFLREELVRQMQQTPVDKLTVQGLCDACGVSKQTFYRHYADKYALLEECFELYVLKPFEEGVGHMSFYDSLVRHFHTMRDQQTFVRNGYLSSDVNGLYQVDVRLTRSALEGRLREQGVDVTDSLVSFALGVNLYGSITLIREWVLGGMHASDEEMAWLVTATMPDVIRPYFVTNVELAGLARRFGCVYGGNGLGKA